MKILNFGSCNIDYVYGIDHIVEPGETEQSNSLEVFAGGKGLNQSLAIRRAGCEVFHAGAVGNNGEMLLDILQKNKVDTSYIQQFDKFPSGHAIIQVDKNGENSILVCKGTNGMITADYIDHVLSNFEKGDFLLLQNELSNTEYVIDRAFEKQMTVIFNPSPVDEKIRKIDLNKVSHLIINEIEAQIIFGENNPEKAIAVALANYPSLKLVITLGKRGSVYADKEGTVYQNAFLAPHVDTTAAGDTFTGYFVAGLATRRPIKEIMKIASAASAIAVGIKGASSSIPLKSTVAKQLAGMSERLINCEEERIFDKIKKYIDDHITDADILCASQALGISPGTINRTLKNHAEVTFKKFVISQRVSLAARLLKETDLSIAEIVEHTGYENASYFRKKFQQAYGTTPKHYRTEEKS